MKYVEKFAAMMVNVPEPSIHKDQDPEATLRSTLVHAISSLLTQADAKFLLLENFGLDIAVVIQYGDKNYWRFLEAKAYVGSRTGGVNVGSHKGAGRQLDLLYHDVSELQPFDGSWA
jgi:hypothetical protein